MNFITNYWWVFLAVGVICTLYAFLNQARRFSSTRDAIFDAFNSGSLDVRKPINGFFSGFGSMFVAVILSGLCYLLAAIGVIINIIQIAKA